MTRPHDANEFEQPRGGELVVRTSPTFLEEVFQQIRPRLQPARDAGCDTSRVYLLLDELLSNIFRHGYRGAEGQPIGVQVRVQGEYCYVALRDLAPTFDSPRSAAHRALPSPESGKTGGRGLVIVHRMCESFEHRVPAEGGNALYLVMKLIRRSATADDRVVQPPQDMAPAVPGDVAPRAPDAEEPRR
ncbi:MAG: ATP-binding protein [Candidatus Latescibacterota bacterium]|nr:MAG: ATP-binding protein [Candidatus Latescibacterota bacterium]